MIRIISLCLFLFSFNLHAKLEFYFAPDTLWVSDILNMEKEIHDFLGVQFHQPKTIRVAYDELSDISFSFSKNAIFLAEFEPTLFTHEYTHALFNDYLFEKSGAWFYFTIKNFIQGRSIEEEIIDVSARIKRNKETVADFIARGSPQKYIDNLNRTIKSDEENIPLFEKALALEQAEPGYEKAYLNINFFKLLAPYHELVADTLPVLIFKDWSIVRAASEQALKDRGEILKLPEGVEFESFISHREFNFVEDEYFFEEWEIESPYTQFKPVRSHIRQLSDSMPGSILMKKLFEAVLDEFEQRVLDSGLWEMKLPLKNQRMIDKIPF